MDRRGFLRATGGALGAAVGALALKRGIGLPEAERGVQGQPVSENTLAARGTAFMQPDWAFDADSAMRIATQSEWAFDRYAEQAGAMTLVTGPDPAVTNHTHPIALPPMSGGDANFIYIDGLGIGKIMPAGTAPAFLGEPLLP